MQFRYKKITVKIGSNVLAKADGTLNVERIAHLVDQIAFLHKNGIEVVLVSSGAVAAGRAILEPSKKADAVSRRQLWAALGQVKLISRYSDFFNERDLICAQVLTTKENFSSRGHYLNMKNCFNTLLENKVIPIVNENDTISVTELMFTDNDELSGLIASMVNSEALIILTNVDGIYDSHPKNENAEVIRVIKLENEGPAGSKDRFAAYPVPDDLRGRNGDWAEEYPDYLGCIHSLDANLGRLREAPRNLRVSAGGAGSHA